MDSINQYKTIVLDYLQEVANLTPSGLTETIVDEQHNQYLLYSNYWEENQRRYGCFLHIQIKPDGKVWIQHDGTDLSVAQQLVERGIPKNQIVLGFRAPFYRQMSDFAVARVVHPLKPQNPRIPIRHSKNSSFQFHRCLPPTSPS